MIVDTYMCTTCFEPKAFNSSNSNVNHKCPKCGKEMEYWCTEEIDGDSGKVINREVNNDSDEKIDIKAIVTGKSTVTCPYCHSTDTKKISGLSKAGSVAMWGVLAAGKVSKQWHCNSCGSDF